MKYIKKILDNGITIIMVPQATTQLIAMGFFVKAGSRNENNETNGIAHFLEHMMFKGTSTRSADKLFWELDMLGAYYNAATTTQNTYYYIYGNSDDTKKLLDIMLDIYINPQFNTKEIEKEKKVIIEEMRMRNDMPLVKLYSGIHRKIFKGTSLARDIIGKPETILNFNQKDLLNFRKSLYKPNNTVFVITGNFNPMPIYKMIVPVLKPLENPSVAALTYFDEKPIIIKNMMAQEEPYVYIKKNTMYQQVYILLVFPLYDMYKTKYREINLISNLLTTGFSSRLNKSLREDNGITYSLTSYPIIYSDSGMFIIQIILNPDELVTGLKILFAELKKIKDHLVTKDEITKIINITKNESIFSFTQPFDMLTYFGLNFLSDRNFKPEIKKEFESLKKITRTRLQKVATDIFVRDKINLFIYGNTNETNFDFIEL